MRYVPWGRLLLGLVVGTWLSSAHGCSSRPAAEKGGGKSPVEDGELVIGEPLTHKNLTIFLVSSKVDRNNDRFITLDEGLKAGTVKISELGSPNDDTDGEQPAKPADAPDEMPAEQANDSRQDDPFDDGDDSPQDNPIADVDHSWQADPFAGSGDDVNRLLVTNLSDRPLYLMPGEIFVGGNQDRTLVQEMIVPAGTRRMPIGVFCVEHGRWATRDQQTSGLFAANLSILTVVDGDQVAQRAAKGEFPMCGGYLSKQVRLTVQDGKGQGDVWDDVAQANGRFNVNNGSDAFTANYVDPDMVGRLKPYVDALNARVARADRVVGVVVAINGKVDAADVFESTPLFRKLWPKLLKSYALDAAAAADDDDDEVRPSSVADARTFLNKAQQADVKQKETDLGLVTTSADFGGVASFSLHEQRESSLSAGFEPVTPGRAGADGMMGGMGGSGVGGGVHSAAFSR